MGRAWLLGFLKLHKVWDGERYEREGKFEHVETLLALDPSRHKPKSYRHEPVTIWDGEVKKREE